MEMYKELLTLMEEYKTRERAAEGVDRMLTLSTSVTTRQNSSKLGFVLAAPSVSRDGGGRPACAGVPAE